jgi:hypothetical protein
LASPPDATNPSPRTVRGYTDDCALFAAFLIDKAVPFLGCHEDSTVSGRPDDE